MMNKRTKWTLSRLLPAAILLVLMPLLAAESAQGKRLVIIDAAHGGTDAGVTVTDRVQEKEITLLLAQLLQKELTKSAGIQVQLTRTSDKTLSHAERVKMAGAVSGEAMFISLHVNAGFGKKAAGYELYFPGFKAPATEQSDSRAILQDMAQNRHLNGSVRLAQMIQRNMESIFPRKGRGLRDAPVPMLGDLSMPAVILEVGFATQPDDRKKILNEKTQQAIAQSLAKSIGDFF